MSNKEKALNLALTEMVEPERYRYGGLIYYIISVETKRVKIGFTTGHPLKRLKALQTGSPTKLSLLAIHPGDIEHERILHNRFAGDCEHGEWFNITDELIDHVECMVIIMAFDAAHKGEKPDPWITTALSVIFKDEPMPPELAAIL